MDNKISITPSEVIEYLYCPRFIYYMLYLKIPQYEENRYKVMLGRDIHKRKASINKEYLRKKIGVEKKLIEQKLTSKRYHIHGVIDEILFLKDGTGASLDYKFAKYKDKIFKTYKYQAAMYGMMIQENFNIKVNRAFIVYIRSKNLVKEIKLNDNIFSEVSRILEEIIEIIHKGYYPKATQSKRRCLDCTYRNICIK